MSRTFVICLFLIQFGAIIVNSEEPIEELPYNVEENQSNEQNLNSTEPLVSLLEQCENVCPRFYRPICVSVDGIQMTAATRCEFNNKLRCARKLRSAGQKAPVLQYLHRGECNEDEISEVYPERINDKWLSW